MAINYEQLMAMKRLDQRYSYSDRDVLLYALGIGMGADSLDEKELAFVNEATVTAATEGHSDLCLSRSELR